MKLKYLEEIHKACKNRTEDINDDDHYYTIVCYSNQGIEVDVCNIKDKLEAIKFFNKFENAELLENLSHNDYSEKIDPIEDDIKEDEKQRRADMEFFLRC